MKNPRQRYMFTYSGGSESVCYLFRDSAQDLAAQKRWFKKRYPNCMLSKVEPDWVVPLLAELGKPENAEALKRLRDKCEWEHMSLTAVLLDYGDPREWK